jgi:hypothetical protein
MNDLPGLTVFADEGGAQGLVPLYQGVEALLEQLAAQRTAQAQRPGNIVGRGAGLELIEEPEALLGKGRRHGPLARSAHDPLLPGIGLHALYSFGNTGHRRRLEDRPQREIDMKGLADARYDLSCEQRVAAE